MLAAGALAGILAAAVALGVAELAAAVIGPNSAPVIAVGETAINLTPIPVKDFAITHFGSHDKQALIAGILVMLTGFAALIGVAAVRRIGYGMAGLAVFAGLGVTAALRLPGGWPARRGAHPGRGDGGGGGAGHAGAFGAARGTAGAGHGRGDRRLGDPARSGHGRGDR